MPEKVWRIQIVGLADGRPSPVDGRWLVSCDVDAMQGRGVVKATRRKERARTFGSNLEAFAYWQRRSTVVPTRPDGKPNRPLTAYTITVDSK